MRTTLLCSLALLFPCLAAAERGPLDRRVEEIRALICDEPRDYEKLFAPAFLRAIPPVKIKQILRDTFRDGGKVTSVVEVARKSPLAAEYRFYTKTKVFPVKLGVSQEAPHRIAMIWFGALAPRHRRLEEVGRALKTLPGEVSFAVCRLGGREPKHLHAINPEAPLALGSTFKLYVLGALVAAIQKGERRWEEVIPLRQEWKSWPSGSLHRWPAGAPVTLSSLAQLMISVSDNTATDHLLLHLGRPTVEAMLAPMGVKQPEKSRPFLTTRETFLLHAAGSRLAEYLRRDAEGRRLFLENVLAKIAWREQIEHTDRPTAIGEVEWFASASDLCRTFDWLRRNASGPKTELALKTLAINPGLSFRGSAWRYVGYKGGSEPGVLNLSWLLQRRNGEWLVLTAGWNDPKAPLDDDRLLQLMQSAILLLEDQR